jgi:beta-glucosidase
MHSKKTWMAGIWMAGIGRSVSFLTCIAALIFCSALSAQAPRPASPSGNSEKMPWLDTSLPLDQRVDALVGQMTLEEKASQVVHLSAAIPRLQVPAYNWWTEALHGVLTSKATVFPEPIALAATFDTARIHEMAIAIGNEARAKYERDIAAGRHQGIGLDFWSPNINIFRDPRWGRGQETYGEDPFLTGRMGVAYVTGMQGDDPKYYRVISTPKHYAVHSGPEPERHRIDVKVSKHDEEDTYLPAFRAAVVEGKAGSVMCVYNSVNGEPGCANEFLLEDQLRGKWKFDGYVVSDCDAVYDIYRGHHYTKTLAEAGAISMKRGTDLDCNEPGNNYSRYVDAVKQGLLTDAELTTAVKRLFTARFRLGMFDPPSMVKYASTPPSEIESEPHRQLALQLGRESMVLLKNDGTLPLKASVKKIAVVGPLADQDRVLWGNYNGTPSHTVTALDGIRAEFSSAAVTFSPGTTFLRTGEAVPVNALRSPDSKPGLKAEYFANTELTGSPLMTRIDKQVDFDFSGVSPAKGIGPQNFSVRWTGSITPRQSGPYQLAFTGDDGYRVWLDGKLLFEDWGTHGPSTKSAEVEFEKGHSYAIRLEYFQAGGGAVAKFSWAFMRGDPLKEALDTAKDADVVVALVGITSLLEGEEMAVNLPGFKGGDRTSLDLPAEEEKLLESLKAAGKPLVVVLLNGSALAVNWAGENANAIVDAWYPGEEGGAAIAETLSGRNNPAGRLPVTFYKGVDQLPGFEDYSMKNRTYRYFTGKPLYPFGYGLSYSSFVYSGLKTANSLKAGDPLTVEADVKNTSAVDGDEVAELYLTYPQLPGAPLRALRGFTRVHLNAGTSLHVTFTLTPRDLSMVDESGDRLVAPGVYSVSIGSGQPGTDAPGVDGSFQIMGEEKLPD